LLEEEAAKREELNVLKEREFKVMEENLLYMVEEEVKVFL